MIVCDDLVTQFGAVVRFAPSPLIRAPRHESDGRIFMACPWPYYSVFTVTGKDMHSYNKTDIAKHCCKRMEKRLQATLSI